MIYKTYKLTFEKFVKIMDLTIFKNHLNLGKSFSFLIECNVYANEIESIELCNENYTSLLISGECGSIVDVYDYNDVLLGEVSLPEIKDIEDQGKLTEFNIDHLKLNVLLKSYMENTFKKKIVVNESVIEKEKVILRLQKIIISKKHDTEILNINSYETLHEFFKYITKDLNSYVRKASNTCTTSPKETNSELTQNERIDNKSKNLKYDNVKQEKDNKEINKSTLKRLEYLKTKLREINYIGK